MLAKIWIEGKLYTLLVRMQSSSDTLEMNTEVSEMGKNGATIWLSDCTPEYCVACVSVISGFIMEWQMVKRESPESKDS